MITHVILDRDGVINHDSPDYIKHAGEWHAIDGSLAAISALSQLMPVYIATNQAGIGRGIITQPNLDAIHQKLTNAVSECGGVISDLVFCPHHPDDECECRKPKPGLLHQLATRHQFDLSQTIYIGDSVKDIEAAEAAGCKPALVLTGNGKASHRKRPDVSYANDLAAWSQRLLAN